MTNTDHDNDRGRSREVPPAAQRQASAQRVYAAVIAAYINDISERPPRLTRS